MQNEQNSHQNGSQNSNANGIGTLNSQLSDPQPPPPLTDSPAPPSTPDTRHSGYSPLSRPDATPSPEPVDGKLLLDTLSALASKFVILPPRAADAIALYVLHTYAFRLRDISAYLGIESPLKRCGKTTLLSFLAELFHRPIPAANVSPSALFRVIEEFSPTLLIDEADTFLANNEQLRGILNAGNKPETAFVLRATASLAAPKPGEGGSSSSSFDSETLNSQLPNSQLPAVRRYSCWCPKIIASIGHLPDTLADRCILIRMQRKMMNEVCARLRELKAEPLRQQCKRFVLDNAEKISTSRPESEPSLNDRAADIWEPLFVLADIAGGDWPQRARQAAAVLSASAQDNNPVGSLLLDIFAVLYQAPDNRLYTRDLVARLNTFTWRPWYEARDGKPITDLWLARQLRPYGVRPRTFWIGNTHGKGYAQEDLTDTFRRYISHADLAALKAEAAAEKPPEKKPDTSDGTSLTA